LAQTDCVVILTDHSGLPYDRILAHVPVVVDTRNALGRFDAASIILL
jgi:UDP-N-acetyl-D-glucosamine dehydrogenase